MGDLNLHLNYLIPWCMEISHLQFGTLFIGIFCQIWTPWDLSYNSFWNCQFMITPGPFKYFFFKKRPLQTIKDITKQCIKIPTLGLAWGGQIYICRLHDGTSFGGATHLKGHHRLSKKFAFWHICGGLTLHALVGTIVSLAVFPVSAKCYTPFLACNTRNLSLSWLYQPVLQCIWGHTFAWTCFTS